ncbi:MAG: AMP-binding protein [Gemmatimonadota bacterium]
MVFDVLAASAADPNATVLVDAGTGERYSRGQLEDRVSARAESWRGEPQGGVLPLVVGPTTDSVVDLLSVWRAGLVPAPLNAALAPVERDAARAELMDSPAVPDAHVVLWSSGTSGRPRGVVLGAEAFQSITRGAVSRLGVGSEDVWALTLSPAHVGGLALVMRSIALGGVLITLPDTTSPTLSDALDADELAITRLSLVPIQLRRLLDERGSRRAPGRLRSVLIGGAHAPPSLVEAAVQTGWPIALTYGATEMTSQITTATPEETAAAPGHVGRAMPGVDVRVDADGGVLARGDTVALGRIGATGLESILDADGWYATGDVGALDAQGRLSITGRRIDRIVTGGTTVDAREVEEVLRGLPGVLDAVVVGVPDAEWGERIGAWIVSEPEGGIASWPAALEDACAARLHPAKRPRVWAFGSALPRNANGKVDREAVRARLAESS